MHSTAQSDTFEFNWQESRGFYSRLNSIFFRKGGGERGRFKSHGYSPQLVGGSCFMLIKERDSAIA